MTNRESNVVLIPAFRCESNRAAPDGELTTVSYPDRLRSRKRLLVPFS